MTIITFFRVETSGKRRWLIATAILKPCTRRCWRRTPSSSYHRCRPRWAEEGEVVVGGGWLFFFECLDAMHVFFLAWTKYGRKWYIFKTRTISTCSNKHMFKSDIFFLNYKTMPGDNLSIGVVSVLFHVPTNLYTTPPKIPICSLDGGIFPRYPRPSKSTSIKLAQKFWSYQKSTKKVHPEKE